MILNGKSLLDRKPLIPMVEGKHKKHGVSYGLSQAGYDIRIKQSVTLHPFRRFALASTFERFQMPENLVGVLHDKSTHIRRGLMVGNSVLEPGWDGHLTLELFYMGRGILRIPAGSGIGQIIFHELTEQASYASGKYQFQPDRPVPAIMDRVKKTDTRSQK